MALYEKAPQIARFMGPKWGPHGSYRPQMGPMLAPQTLLSGTMPVLDTMIMISSALDLNGFSIVMSFTPQPYKCTKRKYFEYRPYFKGTLP